MPTYTYECSACGHRFDALESMSSMPQKTCPKCSKDTLSRVIGTGAGLLFKGSGFYATDYKKGTTASKKVSDSDSQVGCSCCKAGSDSCPASKG